MSKYGKETVWGEAWWLADGEMKKICENGEVRDL